MEVHHPHHAPKSWKGYITEFLMLFAAVSLGFLAENIREIYIEKERAHELLQSFMNDVNANVKSLDSLIDGNRRMIMKNDSAVLYLMKNDQIDLDTLFDMLPLQSYRYLNNNETYDQMKSSGSLRYIKDSTLLRNIIDYNITSEAAEFRSVTYEADYVGHQYIDVLQKWMPSEIAIKRQASPYLNRTDYKAMLKTKEDESLMKELYALALNKKSIISGKDVEYMRNEVVPVISRKISLVSGSEAMMIKTKSKGEFLLNYYKNHHN
ncbi:MAG: hypothetical protein EBS95_08635 [Chitinophagia bacterium]|nr:hypothetical protein [Chitinophagia bacterium]